MDYTRKICPYGIILRENHWYIPPYCCEAKDRRMFRIDRIKSLELTKERFKYPEVFSIQDIIKNSWAIFYNQTNSLFVVELIATGLAVEFVKSK